MTNSLATTCRSALLLLSLVFAACASQPGLDMAALDAAEITNFRAPESRVLSSGQPSQAQLQVMADAGVRHVINLRTPEEELDFDEQAAVEALGMRYYSIPVAGAGGVTASNAATLQSILGDANDEPVLIHCRSGNRVGGLMAVSAHSRGQSIEAALAEGERWGMTSERLQSAVRESLENN